MFEGIIGNEKIKEELQKTIKKETISHSYMFIGTEGIGKKLIAKEFSKSLLCLKTQECNNTCKSCKEFESGNHPDFKIIKPDGNSIKIEQIRELQKKLVEKPIISERKIYIINDADKMTTEAQNCLLKTLEEPPEFAIIILIGANESAFLSTIKSRCTIIHFLPIEDEALERYLKEEKNITIESNIMLKTCQGSVKKAIDLSEKKEQYSQIEELLRQIKRLDIIEIIKKAEILYKEKEEIYNLLDYMNVNLIYLSSQDYKYTEGVQIVENTKKRLQSNANYDMSIDNMLFQLEEKLK